MFLVFFMSLCCRLYLYVSLRFIKNFCLKGELSIFVYSYGFCALCASVSPDADTLILSKIAVTLFLF